jgi:hypothetical protein
MLEYFPDPYSDELLYSIWARYSDNVRYTNKSEVLQELFGTTNVPATVDLPSHLGYFVANLPYDHTYTIDYFIDHHTLLPFYGAFRSKDYYTRIREQMISDSGQALHRRAGVATFSILLPKWLRYCPRCVQMDRETVGESYWHRLHQVPGVEICPIHRTWLENSAVRARNALISPEFISAERSLVTTTPRDAVTSPYFQTLMDIAVDFSYLLEHSSHSDPHLLRKRYRALLSQRGFLPTAKRIRFYDCLKGFMDCYPQPLLATLQCEIKSSCPYTKCWLSKVIHSSEIAQHPLHHILTIRFFGSSAETFFRLDIEPTRPFGEGPWPCLNPACEHYHERRISTCQIHLRPADRRPEGKFACTCGFIYCRKGPDSSPEDAFRKDHVFAYGQKWETLLHDLWLDPAMSLSRISRRLAVTNSTVKLHALKLHLPFPRISVWSTVTDITQPPKKDISWYRSEWLALMQDAPQEEGMVMLRRKLPGVYDVLLKYDREWLLAHRRPKKSRSVQLPLLFDTSSDELSQTFPHLY